MIDISRIKQRATHFNQGAKKFIKFKIVNGWIDLFNKGDCYYQYTITEQSNLGKQMFR